MLRSDEPLHVNGLVVLRSRHVARGDPGFQEAHPPQAITRFVVRGAAGAVIEQGGDIRIP